MTHTLPLKTAAQAVGLQVAQLLQGRSDKEIREFINEMHAVIQGGGLAVIPHKGGVN